MAYIFPKKITFGLLMNDSSMASQQNIFIDDDSDEPDNDFVVDEFGNEVRYENDECTKKIQIKEDIGKFLEQMRQREYNS